MLQSVFSERQRGLRNYRATGFMTARTSAKDIFEGMNVAAFLQQKRLRSTKRHFSYESFDGPLSDALKKLEVTFFNVVADAATLAQPFRKDSPHWKMWERSLECCQPSKVSQMRS